MSTRLPQEFHRPRLWVLVAVVATLWPSWVSAADFQAGLEVANTFFAQTNYLDRFKGRYDKDRRFNLLSVTPTLTLSLEKNAILFARGDLQWTYEPDAELENDDSDEALEAFLTSAYLSMGGKTLQTIVGLQPIQFGNGLIAVDDAPALTLSAARGRWFINAQAARVMERSPMAGLSLGYEPGLFERLALFWAWFRDDEDAFARTLPDLYQLLEPTSQGSLCWIGASGELFVGKALLSLTAAYERGDITFDHLLGRTHRDVEAYLGDFALETNLASWLSLRLFFFMASGDEDFGDKTLRAFISPPAYNPRALIFFDPEWLDRDTTSIMTFGGATAAGVLAPGIGFTLTPVEGLLIEAGWAAFYPHEAPQDDRDHYGWEVDLQMRYPFWPNTEVYLEAARFAYGSFFKNSQGRIPDAALLFSVGCRVSF